jgi:hypothetical protein
MKRSYFPLDGTALAILSKLQDHFEAAHGKRPSGVWVIRTALVRVWKSVEAGETTQNDLPRQVKEGAK